MTNTKDSLRRDDMTPTRTSAFDALPVTTQRALKRAASRGTANLPEALPEGWLMVPSRNGLRQVAIAGTRAWVF